MILDFNEEFSHSILDDIDTIIVGAGAAGTSFCLDYVESKKKILLIESGDFDFDHLTQELYEGSNKGLPYFDLDACRLRQVGGTTNLWNGWLRPLDPIDFEKKDFLPLSGWPFSYSRLENFYPKALHILDGGEYNFNADDNKPFGVSFPDFNEDLLKTKVWKYSTPYTRIKEKYKQFFEESENLILLTNANLCDISLNKEHKEVHKVLIKNLDKKEMFVSSKNYILALGGLENPRLLLNCTKDLKEGLGNKFDMVGRCFMEHPHIETHPNKGDDAGKLILFNDSVSRAYGQYFPKGGHVFPGITLSERAQRELEVLNFSITLGGKKYIESSNGIKSLIMMKQSLKEKNIREFYIGFKLAMTSLDEVYEVLYSKLTKSQKLYNNELNLFVRSEQAPNKESRVILSEEKDKLGMNKIILDWKMKDIDKQTLLEAYKILGKEFGRLNIGRVKVPSWLLENKPWPKSLKGGYHHIGTTRMSDRYEEGVVNKDLRVHGIDNLYVAGSSVFPTSGYANPTLTIVALSLKLSEHLKNK